MLHFDPQRNYSGISFLKLPLGLHLGFKPWKEPASTAKDEVKALELVRRYTSIPVSRHGTPSLVLGPTGHMMTARTGS